MMLAAPVAQPDGAAPQPRFFIVPKSDYAMIDTWHAMGLAGTGSKDLATDNFRARASQPRGRAAKARRIRAARSIPAPLYKLAWYALFGFVNGATALGIAQGAIDEFTTSTRARVATATGGSMSPISPPCSSASPKRRP